MKHLRNIRKLQKYLKETKDSSADLDMDRTFEPFDDFLKIADPHNPEKQKIAYSKEAMSPR